jgi:hypothetical protein
MPELMWRDLQAELLPETLRDLFRQGLRGFLLPAGPGEEPVVIEAPALSAAGADGCIRRSRT